MKTINMSTTDTLSTWTDNPLLSGTTKRTTLHTLTSTTIMPQNNTAVTDYFYQVEQLTFLWILFTLIVIGNATVLIALILSKGRKSRMNFFIKNLAAADLCVGLISVLTDIIWKITISWEAGLIACKLIRFSQATVTYASTYVLVALSIDRYDAITHPMNFSGSWKRAKLLVIIAWLLSFLFSLPVLIFYSTTETEQFGTQCWIDFTEDWQWKLYMTLVSVTLFVIPAILIAACYIIIVVTIWSKGKEMHVAANPTTSNGDSVIKEPACEALIKKRQRKNQNSKKSKSDRKSIEEAENRRASSRGLIPKAKVKTVKMTFVIIFVFILCWSPYIVFDLLQVYDYIPDTKTMTAVATFIQSLAPLNSAANPIIYCLFSTNAGSNLCNIFRRKSAMSKSMRNGSTNGGKRGRHRGHPILISHNTAQTTKSTTLHSDSLGMENNGVGKLHSRQFVPNRNGTHFRNSQSDGKCASGLLISSSPKVAEDTTNPLPNMSCLNGNKRSKEAISKTYSVDINSPESTSPKKHLVKALVSSDL